MTFEIILRTFDCGIGRFFIFAKDVGVRSLVGFNLISALGN